MAKPRLRRKGQRRASRFLSGRPGIPALVAQRLMEEIRQGVWRPGDKLLTERQLAVDFGLSRSSLREALRALEVLGLLQIRQGSGVYISSLTPEELLLPLHFFISLDPGNLEALFEARISIEPFVAGLAAQRATSLELSAIRSSIGAASTGKAGIESFIAADFKFHGLIAAAAHNSILERMVKSLGILGQASREITGHMPGVVNKSAKDHLLIMTALEAREPDIATSAMAAHLHNVRAAFRRQQSQKARHGTQQSLTR